jgi:hypothetical protein
MPFRVAESLHLFLASLVRRDDLFEHRGFQELLLDHTDHRLVLKVHLPIESRKTDDEAIIILDRNTLCEISITTALSSIIH